MSKIRFISVSFENFKGFKKQSILFDQYQAVVLAGKNGFGKTTVFDAIELVFTGKIKRYESYLAYHRHNTALSQHSLPLVFDNKIPNIKVSVLLKIDCTYINLYREEQTANITNPIYFDKVFNKLKIKYKDNGTEIDEDYHGQFGLEEFFNSYSFLNYVSQEEATAFLKSKETDRSRQINELFNTTLIDNKISKVNLIEKKLKDVKKIFDSRIKDLSQELEYMDKGDDGKEYEYHRLVSGKDFDWDKEAPQLSYEKFNSILCDNGVLDQLTYFFNHYQDYTKWLENKNIDKLISSPLFQNFPYYMYLILNKDKYILYDIFKTRLLPAINNVTTDNLSDTITPILQESFADEVDKDLQEEIMSLFKSIQPVGRSASILGKAFAELQNERGKIKSILDKTYADLDIKQCPLCGQEYEDSNKLKEKIDSYEHILSDAYPELQKGLANMIKHLRELLSEIVDSLQTKFEKWKLTDFGYAKYKEIDFEAYNSYLKEILKFGHIQYDDNKTLEDYLSLLRIRLTDAKYDIDDSLDYSTLEKTYSTLAKYIDIKDLSIEKIENKRDYLITQWNIIKSRQYKYKESELVKYHNKQAYCNDKIQKLKQLKENLVLYKNSYLEKVIADIEILFYVYSGRIMQENYFGRGLFIKNETKLKRVLFVSDYNSDVDALYNLSSGQLVAIVYAFVMSLNKLYSSQSFIAIDDPVQTIDDINVWGFIETIRHAFNDYNILVSTHEDNYASLLRYKFDKIGIKAKCIDMSNIRNN